MTKGCAMEPGKKRIIGTETEWITIVYSKESGVIFPLAGEFFNTTACGYVKNFFALLPEELASSALEFPEYKIWLLNGGLLYIDTGFHLEYATPEGLGPRRAYIYERAGERVVEYLFARANERELRPGGILCAFKSNLDVTESNSCGAHESYRIALQPSFDEFVWLLGPFLISRPVFCGNGHVSTIGETISYHLSQRARTIKFAISGGTTENRAIINTRNEPLGDCHEARRLHVILGDATLAEVATYWKLGATSLVLDMIEERWLTKCPVGKSDNGFSLVTALHAFSEDPTLRAAYRFGHGSYTAVDILECYRNHARRFCEETGRMDEENARVLYWWDFLLAQAKKPRPHEALYPFVDWANKKVIIERDMERRRYDWNTPKNIVMPHNREKAAAVKDHLRTLAFQYHENSPRGLARLCGKREQEAIQTFHAPYAIASKEEFDAAFLQPFPETRAWARRCELQEAARKAREAGRKYRVELFNWMLTRVKDGLDPIIVYNDKNPYAIEPNAENWFE